MQENVGLDLDPMAKASNCRKSLAYKDVTLAPNPHEADKIVCGDGLVLPLV